MKPLSSHPASLALINVLVAAIIGSLGAGAALAADDTHVTGQGVVNVTFRPPDAATDAPFPFVFTFHGKQHAEPVWVLNPDAPAPRLTPSEEFLLDVFEANRAELPDDLLTLWHPEERPELFEGLGNQETFERNRSFYRNLRRAGIVAELHYGDYTVFVVLHSGELIESHIQLYPVLRSGDRYFLTNRLQDDPLLQFVFFIYEDRLTELLESTTATRR